MAKAIKVDTLSKAYQLGDFGTGTISRDLERYWARLRGKEDPFLKIGEINDRTSKGKSDVVWSLKNLNFEIEQGDAVGIIGRNGAGKSTLLKILSRVTSPTTGTIKVKGRIASLLEVGTGFHPELTGRENIYLNGAILGMRKAEIKRKFDEIVDFSGVERYIDTPVKRYSSGMYVRLAFAVAAHLESEILIVDEVLAVGDAEFQKKCLGKMGDVSKGEGRTVLFVSHNMEAVSNLCNTGLLLNNGEIAFSGTTYDTIAKYSVVADEIFKSKITDHALSPDVTVDLFEIDKSELTTGNDLAFNLTLSCKTNNNFQSVAIFIYDEYDQKVSFADLRNNDLFAVSAVKNKINISGNLLHLPYLPGKYKIGLHVQSNLLLKDFFGLLHFEIIQKPMTDDILPYPLHVRGRIEIDYNFTIK
ncbi:MULTISPECIES: ABC transporter ATP-binding protein [unclassified Mucilaginibacter]|uniref:ABC transporter ATP-binding protein n=1 Tax=unclassified Mucilaginibacter TaxID=2617802 RepID=UPI002AC8DB47|nr:MULTISPECIES: ABC transporter ATP-binding protein [unclassified Mucilaginibacter]MEB0260647.1 ABC transporter ATP-binding protein [Mucilaginibacter sp. 10I4]MEB0277468.1 ABC transporter ATP-binding protein [Mucilaginibacter sp. 10B2]MEB0302333.1 ABC transporter ATP-binding protein [Mucilaginibacter sp. 5C4]WPX24902.1 ABC transporter ATP-binding protein [Mucilaginibacter sp. 5C4]